MTFCKNSEIIYKTAMMKTVICRKTNERGNIVAESVSLAAADEHHFGAEYRKSHFSRYYVNLR